MRNVCVFLHGITSKILSEQGKTQNNVIVCYHLCQTPVCVCVRVMKYIYIHMITHTYTDTRRLSLCKDIHNTAARSFVLEGLWLRWPGGPLLPQCWSSQQTVLESQGNSRGLGVWVMEPSLPLCSRQPPQALPQITGDLFFTPWPFVLFSFFFLFKTHACITSLII